MVYKVKELMQKKIALTWSCIFVIVKLYRINIC